MVIRNIQNHIIMPENKTNGGSGTDSSASSSAGVRLSNSDREKLQKKRRKNGLCPNCGEVHTHKKNWKHKMVPQVSSVYSYYYIYIDIHLYNLSKYAMHLYLL